MVAARLPALRLTTVDAPEALVVPFTVMVAPAWRVTGVTVIDVVLVTTL